MLTNVSPLTLNGRSALPLSKMGVAAMPPSAPVKDCALAWRMARAEVRAGRSRMAMVENCILIDWLGLVGKESEYWVYKKCAFAKERLALKERKLKESG
jgi:hypothetical protein